MVFKSIIGATCACLVAVSFNANAVVLESRLGGLAYYDPVADLTWLANANGLGVENWVDAKAWVAGLNVGGVTGWRLPETVQPDPNCVTQIPGASYGFNCTDSEMGNLFYNVLGGVAWSSIADVHNDNYLLFNNVQTSAPYWDATDFTAIPNTAWYFFMYNGVQSYNYNTSAYYIWGVHSGDVNAVPVPAAAWLFGSGLLGLVSVARRKQKN